MFIHTIESLDELSDYIKQLDESVGLKPDTYNDVMNAISKERSKLRKVIVADANVPKDVVCQYYEFEWLGGVCAFFLRRKYCCSNSSCSGV